MLIKEYSMKRWTGQALEGTQKAIAGTKLTLCSIQFWTKNFATVTL